MNHEDCQETALVTRASWRLQCMSSLPRATSTEQRGNSCGFGLSHWKELTDRTLRLALLFLVCCAIGACGTRPAQGGMVEMALKLVGLEAVEVPAEVKAAKEAAAKMAAPLTLPLRIHASDQLNSATAGRALPLVLKIYKLKDYEQFKILTYDALSQSQVRSEELISSREVILLPGQRYEAEEPLPQGTTHLAVVALFAAPEENRWRFIFDTRQSAKQGITLGAHRCALSVAQGIPQGAAPEALRLAGTSCR